ncbi:unnamed protein product [Nezara viridula]|uniref:Uncharacterized protein n=1 Tax=Nezara viridula TaxID=85310 RepID=A0A9P0MW49_NEZVI|nr:unnamed protein product [Nezara viridula]
MDNRKADCAIEKEALQWDSPGIRSRGRTREICWRREQNDLNRAGKTCPEVEIIVAKRAKRKALADPLCSTRIPRACIARIEIVDSTARQVAGASPAEAGEVAICRASDTCAEEGVLLVVEDNVNQQHEERCRRLPSPVFLQRRQAVSGPAAQ